MPARPDEERLGLTMVKKRFFQSKRILGRSSGEPSARPADDSAASAGLRRQRDEARQQRDEARQQRDEAKQQRDDAMQQRDAVVEQRDSARRQRDQARDQRDALLGEVEPSTGQKLDSAEAIRIQPGGARCSTAVLSRGRIQDRDHISATTPETEHQATC